MLLYTKMSFACVTMPFMGTKLVLPCMYCSGLFRVYRYAVLCSHSCARSSWMWHWPLQDYSGIYVCSIVLLISGYIAAQAEHCFCQQRVIGLELAVFGTSLPHMSADFEYTRRLTIDGMSDVYASEIAYICSQPANHTLWWSLTSHFAWLRTRGFTMTAKAFFKMFRRDIATSLDSDSYKPRVADTPNQSVLPICTTLVLVSSLWHTAAHTRTPALHGVTLAQYGDQDWNWPSTLHTPPHTTNL